ncbi:MAG TPA: AraC family transcriptional regulator [Kineosporiaceae bacterium]|nr:AraC family transcriptional regulator [Kineosporiaceae bacterium]
MNRSPSWTAPARSVPAPSLPPAPTDLRGIIDPAVMQRHVALHRYPAGAVLDGIVDWFWAVSWQLPEGHEHVQPVLNPPGANISIGTVDDVAAAPGRPLGRVYGVHRGVSERRLIGDGWTVAAKTTVGGLGALITGPAGTLTDARATLDQALDLDGTSLVDRVSACSGEPERIDLLRTALEEVLHGRAPRRVAQARELAAVARLAEHDPAVTRPEQLAAAAGVSVRTLQRLFAEYVGASPAWVIRRWRVIEAAERARADRAGSGGPDGTHAAGTWAEIAAELGYSDQAHLVREFRAVLGTTPAAYAARQPG